MRIGPIYITYNTRTLLTHSSNSNYLEILKAKSTTLKIIEVRINTFINLEILNHQSYH